jgi:hypothetical protein
MERLAARGDVWITGGAYSGAPKSTQERVVGRDIDVWIAPDGSEFWVGGKRYDSWSDTVERQNFGKRYPCQDETLDTYKVDSRQILQGSKKDD